MTLTSRTGPRGRFQRACGSASRQRCRRQEELLCGCPQSSDLAPGHLWTPPTGTMAFKRRKVCTLEMLLFLFPKLQSRRHSWCRTKASLEEGQQLPWALRSPCGASSGFAESQRGRESAAWREWPGCWRSGKRAQRHLLGCPFGVVAWLCCPGGSAAWSGWPRCWRSGRGAQRHLLGRLLGAGAWPYSPEGSAAAPRGRPGPSAPGPTLGRVGSLGAEAGPQGLGWEEGWSRPRAPGGH